MTHSGGRPGTIDPDAVAAIALDLFAEQGYEHTSMEDVARAAGIGRKSLYRHFGTKAELAWGGFEPVVAAARLVLAERDDDGGTPREGTLDRLRRSAVAGVTALPDLSVTRGRLRLIAEHPDLTNRAHETLAPQREAVRAYLAECGTPGDTADYLSAAYIGATFAGWSRWAAGTGPDPTPYLLAAIDVLVPPDRSTNGSP